MITTKFSEMFGLHKRYLLKYSCPSPSISTQRPPYGPGPPPPPVSSPGVVPSSRKQGEDDEEMWRMKQRANEGEINSAIEKARRRREENEKRRETEQKAAAGEKLRQLEERSKKKSEVVCLNFFSHLSFVYISLNGNKM